MAQVGRAVRGWSAFAAATLLVLGLAFAAGGVWLLATGVGTRTRLGRQQLGAIPGQPSDRMHEGKVVRLADVRGLAPEPSLTSRIVDGTGRSCHSEAAMVYGGDLGMGA